VREVQWCKCAGSVELFNECAGIWHVRFVRHPNCGFRACSTESMQNVTCLIQRHHKINERGPKVLVLTFINKKEKRIKRTNSNEIDVLHCGDFANLKIEIPSRNIALD